MQTETTGNITTINTTKFKTTLLKVAFKANLERETITSRLLLSAILRNSSSTYTSKKALNAALEDLYGASLSTSAKKQGQTHVVSFYLQISNEKFLTAAPPLFEDALKVLSEVLLNPRIENGAFNKEVVALEKRMLKEDIESIYDDKTSYALKKMVAAMCADEKFGISGDGYIEDLKNIDEKTLVSTYQSMMTGDEVQITVLGDVTHDEIVSLANQHFKVENDMRPALSAVDTEEKAVADVAHLS
ncbi:MAG: insulinase family protein, partial [Turicibacter sp.]|nr:insulinase family protein [Turicibacter sp.]